MATPSDFKRGMRVRVVEYPQDESEIERLVGNEGTVVAIDEDPFGFVEVRLDKEFDGMLFWLFYPHEIVAV